MSLTKFFTALAGVSIGISMMVLFLTLPGCDAGGKDKVRLDVQRPAQKAGRFKIESHGIFRAGYQNNEREIMVITDSETGVQYLAVTGCGTTQIINQQSGKTSTKVEE